MNTWLLLALAAPLLGFLSWLAFTRSHGFLYLDSLGKKLGFFLAPYGPDWFILLKHVDGRVEQFYDVAVEKGRDRYLLRLGELAVAVDFDPHDTAVPVALADARGPPGKPSPYGLAWRVLVGWAVAVYAAFLAWDFTFLAPLVDQGHGLR